jgi:hypothetical protein
MVAEGVETAAQHEHVKARGVQMGQGWLYTKAMPAGEFVGFVGDQRRASTGTGLRFDVHDRGAHTMHFANPEPRRSPWQHQRRIVSPLIE